MKHDELCERDEFESGLCNCDTRDFSRKSESAGSLRRPPCALMTASASMEADCAALKKICDAGYEVIVVQDSDLEGSLRVIERVRAETANRNITGKSPATADEA